MRPLPIIVGAQGDIIYDRDSYSAGDQIHGLTYARYVYYQLIHNSQSQHIRNFKILKPKHKMRY